LFGDAGDYQTFPPCETCRRLPATWCHAVPFDATPLID